VDELDYICASDVIVNAASVSELKYLLRRHPSRPFGVRLDFNDALHEKRGISPDELLRALPDKDVPLVGLHTYVGTNVADEHEHLAVMREFRSFLDCLPHSVAKGVRYLNVGGGFGYDYRRRLPFRWDHYARALVLLTSDIERVAGRTIGLKLELGRALVVDSGYLVARILHAYEKSNRRFLAIDTNLSHFGRPARYGFNSHFYPYLEDGFHNMAVISHEGNYLSSGSIEAAVVGNSHYSKDWFGFLTLPYWEPDKLVGSLVVFLDAGAYCEAMSDHWGDEPRPASILVSGGKDRLIARRETFDELVFPGRENIDAEMTVRGMRRRK
jgi:diaminopimelate decarboxylase